MDTDRLIIYVLCHQEVYNSHHPEHRNRDLHAGVYKEVATQTQMVSYFILCNTIVT